MRHPALTTPSEERALLDTKWSKGAFGKRKVTLNRLIHAFGTDLDPQSTSWMTSSLERARFWNLSTPKDIRESFPAPLSPYRSRTVFNRGATFTPSRKRSVGPSNSTCSTRARARTTNSTVRCQYPSILDESHPRLSQKFGSGDPSLNLSIRCSFQVDLPHPTHQPDDRRVLPCYHLEFTGWNRLFLWFFD